MPARTTKEVHDGRAERWIRTSWKRWLAICLVAGAIVYFLFFASNGGGGGGGLYG